MDEIFPALLHQGFNLLYRHLVDSVALGYLSVRWRRVKVVFVNKVRQETYVLHESFFLKTLEKPID